MRQNKGFRLVNLNKMPSKLLLLLLSKGPWFIFFLAIVGGFTYQSWGVSREYFEYRTTPFVAIQDYPDKELTVPSIVMCMRFDIDPSTESKISKLLTGEKNYFNDNDDSWKLINWRARLTPGENLTHVTKKYILRNRYCVFIKVLNKFKMEEVTSPRYLTMSYFYRLNVSMTPIHSPNVFAVYAKSHCAPKPVYFQIVSGEESISNPRNPVVVRSMCTRTTPNYKVDLTYSSSINVRSPPPFDTNCLDYPKNGNFLSSHDCYEKCLKRKSLPWNIVPGMTVINSEEYKSSDADILPGDIAEEKLPDKLPAKLIDSYQVLQSNWKGIKESCRQSCYRPDCYTETITPIVTYFISGPTKNNRTVLSHTYNRLMTSDHPIAKVAYVPRQTLLDYIVYMCSGLSFWLGFCPLTMVTKFDKRLRDCKKRKTRLSALQRLRIEHVELEKVC